MTPITPLAIGQQILLCQLAMMKFHDRRAEVKRHRIGKKRPKSNQRAALDAIVLHSMSFDRGSTIADLDDYDGVDAHFAVLRSGDILYLHDVSEYLNASNDFNDRSIAIEFAGNPPDENGKIFLPEGKKPGATFGPHIPTVEQIEGGRRLVRLLTQVHGIRHIYGHKQSCGGKICPGPHVWHNVGIWAVQELGLDSGGPGYWTSNEYCSGRVIPKVWNDAKFDLFPNQSDMLNRYLSELSRPTPIP